jgi:hypothetical protein
MKWFDRWLIRKWRWAYDNRDEIELITSSGSIIDRRTDRSKSRHYIITDDEDFNTELGKIITMESMRQT